MLESNGDLYSCDHYAYPAYRLGNIREHSITHLLGSQKQSGFGAAKWQRLPARCRQCAALAACGGGCPKHRFVRAGDDDEPTSYLCPSYRRFFAHAEPALSRIVASVLSQPSA